MQRRMSASAIRLTVVTLCAILLQVLSPSLVHAQAHEVGYYPNPNETCQNIVRTVAITGIGMTAVGVVVPHPIAKVIGVLGVTVEAIVFFGGGLCENLDNGIRDRFVRAYDEALNNGVRPGVASNDVHYWVGGIMIQDFTGVVDSSGNQIGDGWGAIISDGAHGSQPHFVYGSTWEAYKRAVYEKSVLGGGIDPGYPTSFQKQWKQVTIQDFSGSSWGISAIIGGNNPTAWLVAGNHLQAYIDADGSNTLRSPLGPVEFIDGWYVQKFEGGRILELAGETRVDYYVASDTPAELPAVGYEEPSSPPIEAVPSEDSASCNSSGVPQITDGLSYSPENPDTTTPVEFSFTITNMGCETWAPKVLAIGGRDPYGVVSDPLQIGDFVLGPGESQTIAQTTVLSIPGTHEFFMAYLWTNDHWNQIPDASDVFQHIYINVTEAGVGESAGSTMQTTAEVNMRSGPDIGAQVLFVVASGTQCSVLGRSDSADGRHWYQLDCGSARIGWVSGKNLRSGSANGPAATSGGFAVNTTVETTASNLKMRSGAGTNNSVLHTLSSGVQCTVLAGPISATDYQWYWLDCGNSRVGWVVADFLRRA